MSTTFYRFVTVLLTCGMPFVRAGHAFAEPPATLAEALKRSTYTVRRTPLIIVNAEGRHWSLPTREMQQKLETLYQGDDAKPPLTEIIDCYSSQIVSCSSVQVVAPLTRIEVNPYPGPPEQWAAVNPEVAVKLLFASLTAAQRTIATGAQGIGLKDLNQPEQQVWFRSLIREPFTLTQMKYTNKPRSPLEETGAKEIIPTEKVRVRLVREMYWYYRSRKTGNLRSMNTLSSDSFGGKKPDEPFWLDMKFDERSSYKLLENAIQVKVPNKLKNSDISFNTAPLYGTRISVHGVKTVGELVRRIAEQTKLELYVDRRISPLSLTIIGPDDATVDAADTMKALCYAITGAIRKVSDGTNTVYILTQDRKGTAPAWLQLSEWSAEVSALSERAKQGLEEVARGREFTRQIEFEAGAPNIGSDLMAQVESRIASGESYKQNGTFTRIAVSELPSEFQQRVRADVNSPRAVDTKKEPEDLDPNFINAAFYLKTKIVVPGYGSFDAPELITLNAALRESDALAPEVKRPEIPTGQMPVPAVLSELVALRIAPRNGAETDQAISWAKAKGFKAVFVKTSLWDDADQGRLAHAIAGGKENGIRVYPSVSLLHVAPGTDKSETAPDNLPRTHNLAGETIRQYGVRRKEALAIASEPKNVTHNTMLRDGDWLEAENNKVQQAVAERLHAIAQTQGISGIVLEAGAAPGYELLDLRNFPSASEQLSPVGQQGGYNDELRVALIRQENVDPVDIQTAIQEPYGMQKSDSDLPNKPLEAPVYRKDLSTGMWKTEVPNIAAYERDFAAWGALRRDKNQEWMGQIRRKAALPENLPVYWQAPAQTGEVRESPWVALWKSSAPVPPGDTKSAASSYALLTTMLDSKTTTQSVRTWFAGPFKDWLGYYKPFPYKGWVIDISAVEVEKGLALLDFLAPITKDK